VAATGKARLPTVDSLTGGTISSADGETRTLDLLIANPTQITETTAFRLCKSSFAEMAEYRRMFI